MATATIDAEFVEPVIERNGRIEQVTRIANVTGLTQATPHGLAAEMLTATGMPASGSTISVIVGSIINTLYLEERQCRLAPVDGALTNGVVKLVYNRRETASSDSGTTPTLRGGTTLKQVTTEKDRSGNPLIVEHTWPATDEDYPNKTQETGAEMTVLVPMSSLFGEFTSAESSPGNITKAWSGYVNSDTWQGGDPRTWMCTQANFDLVDDTTTPRTYRFAFSFEYDDQTWDNDTTVVFLDPRTGRPPVGLETDVGVKKIEYYPQRNFGNTF